MLLFSFCFVVVLSARAADFDAGVVAFLEGDYAGALAEWQPLADEGHAGAQFNLGAMYRDGQGVTQDPSEAAWWFSKAAESGHMRAQYGLAAMYAEGDTLPQDFAEAAKWYALAAEQGHAEAQYDLAVLLANGEGVTKDLVSALKWLKLAGAAGIDAAIVGSELLAAEMQPRQVADADRLARVWSARRPEAKGPKLLR